jgi:hypothetical protein
MRGGEFKVERIGDNLGTALKNVVGSGDSRRVESRKAGNVMHRRERLLRGAGFYRFSGADGSRSVDP